MTRAGHVARGNRGAAVSVSSALQAQGGVVVAQQDDLAGWSRRRRCTSGDSVPFSVLLGVVDGRQGRERRNRRGGCGRCARGFLGNVV